MPRYQSTTYSSLDIFGFFIELACLHKVFIVVYSDRIDAFSDSVPDLVKIKRGHPWSRSSFLRKTNMGPGKTYCLTVYHRILWNHKKEYLGELPRPP